MTYPTDTECAVDARDTCIDCNLYEECALRDKQASVSALRLLVYAIALGMLSFLAFVLR